jgi:tRNA nucleotidyltransferase/poly(A) polymerase
VSDVWLDEGLLGEVRAIVRGRECHLVGGAVRDHLLGRAARDLDLVVANDDELADRLTAALDARRIALGGDRFAAVRLVGRKGEGRAFVIDIWDRGDEPLAAELGRRDLTINAIAVDLCDGSWHDPLDGLADLRTMVLRSCSETAFREDPLRALRLARLAAELPGFTVEGRTLELATDSVAALPAVAAERRREELGRALRTGRPEVALEIWAAIGFFPEAFAGTRSAEESLPAVRRALERARGLAQALPKAEAIDHFALHTALAVTGASGRLDVLFEEGYISRAEARRTAFVVECRALPSAPREQRWLLHRAAASWPTALLHAAAWDTERDVAATEALLDRCVRLAQDEAESIFDPEPLLRGDEIRRLLNLETGPEIGRLAKSLRRLQVEGALNERSEAVAWLLSEHRSSSADSAP